MAVMTDRVVYRSMNDPRLQWTRRRRPRRIAVVALLAAEAVVAGAAAWNVPWLVGAGIAAVVPAIVVLNAGVRGLFDLPDDLLDERQRQLKLAGYRQGLAVVGGAVAVAVLAGTALVAGAEDPRPGVALLLAAVPLLLAAPRIAVAWTLEEEDAEDAAEARRAVDDAGHVPDGRRVLRTVVVATFGGGVYGFLLATIGDWLSA